MIWIVGDLHACVRPLERLLREIRFESGRDTLWCVGDLVNTGSRPVETLELLEAVGARSVLGNHDVYAIRAARGWVVRRPDRLDGILSSSQGDRWIAWLADLPLVARIDSPPDRRAGDLLVVHAGFHPSWTDPEETLRRVDCLPRNEDWFEKPEVTFATRVRCCTAAGRRSKQTGPPEECNPPFRPWDSWWNGLDRVVHGHWARRGFHRSGRVMGLDSGCVYGGPLTAWCVEEDRVVQVPGEPLR